jgi:hypothetical protein
MIADYNYIRSYLRQFALNEPLIPMSGFLWGESKRVLDAIAKGGIYPYLWVMDYRFIIETTPANKMNGWWVLRCQVKAQANRADEVGENAAMQQASRIMWNLIAWVWTRYHEHEVIADFSRFNAVPIEVGESDNGHGWEFDLWLGMHENCIKLPEDEDRREYIVLKPKAAAGGTVMAVQSATLTFSAAWDGILPVAGALQTLVANLRADTGLTIEAATDGVYLYARSKVNGAALDLTPLDGAGLHDWDQLHND